jgi:hypothetical protein
MFHVLDIKEASEIDRTIEKLMVQNGLATDGTFSVEVLSIRPKVLDILVSMAANKGWTLEKKNNMLIFTPAETNSNVKKG